MQPQNNQDMNKRLILASMLMFLVFIGWSYLMPPPPAPTDTNSNTNITKNRDNNKAPTVSASTSNDAVNATMQSNTNEPPKIQLSSTIKTILSVKSDDYELKIDELGRIYSFILDGKSYIDNDGKHINVITDRFIRPLELRFSNDKLNSQAFAVPYSSNKSSVVVTDEPQSVVLTQKLDGFVVTKHITFHKDGHYDIDIVMSGQDEYFITPGFRPSVEIDVYTVFQGTLLRQPDDTTKLVEDGDLEASEKFAGSDVVAAVDRYYTTLFYDFDKTFEGSISPYGDEASLTFVRGNGSRSFHGYIGAKDFDTLTKIDRRLVDVIEYGFFTFIAKPLFLLLNYINTIFGNWGWSIVAITALIRLVLYPLTYKGMVSMNKIKELAPKIKELQTKHKDDKQKASAAMMELYKKHGANPMGGCLPMIMQIPVFFAIYRVLMNAVELKGAEWIFWITDLSLKDPFYVLPLLMGATMYIQQVITPNTLQDPMQQKIFKFLPLVFIIFFITFPAGLTLYWFVNNVLSVAQQYYINSLFAKKDVQKSAK
jgi:YidC/Oxa1 family membrane protein insertase